MNRADQKFLDNLLDVDWVDASTNLWELLTGVILDTRTPLERMAQVTHALKRANVLDFRTLRRISRREGSGQVDAILKAAGYPWHGQKSRYFDQDIDFDLETATFEQMMSIKGIGPKLASMWLRIVHKKDVPIIDTHVMRWLRGQGHEAKNYEGWADAMREEAAARGITVAELDRAIVENGIRRRRNIAGRIYIPPRTQHAHTQKVYINLGSGRRERSG